jgi:hypothetical protein
VEAEERGVIMGFIIKQMVKKLLEKGVKIDPTDVMAQMNTQDLIHLLKELF